MRSPAPPSDPAVGVVEDALAGLVASGLALRSDDQAYVVAPPAVALGALITERRDELRLAEQALASLAEEHRAATAGRTISELIEVVTGVDQIRHRFQQVQQAAVTELRTFITAPFVAVPPGENEDEPAAVDRGVRFRGVLERAVLDEPNVLDEVVDSLRHGLELRIVDTLPLKLMLADNDLGRSSRPAWRTRCWSNRSGPRESPGQCCSSAVASWPRSVRCSRACGDRPTR